MGSPGQCYKPAHPPPPSYLIALVTFQEVGKMRYLQKRVLKRFLKMLVTNATAGILIGKGGSALKDLQFRVLGFTV